MRRTIVFCLPILLATACGSSDEKASSSSQPSSTASAPKPAQSSAPAAPKPSATAADATPAPSAVDQSKPENVVNAIFDAAKSGDPSALAGLCEPSVSKDHDVTMICGFKKGDKTWEAFLEDGKSGKITSTKAEGDDAKVDFTYGKDGSKKETIELKKVGDKWYLAKM